MYQVYPRKVGKADALKAITKALKVIRSRADAPADALAWLLERVQAFAASPAGRAGKFTPHPATWFNAGRYDDDAREWQNDHAGNGHARPRRREFEEEKMDLPEEALL